MERLTLKTGYQPGVIGRVAQMHALYYYEHWNFGSFFEAKVASEMAEFMKRYEDGRDLLQTAVTKGQIEGSIVIDGLHAKEKAPTSDGSSYPMFSDHRELAHCLQKMP